MVANRQPQRGESNPAVMGLIAVIVVGALALAIWKTCPEWFSQQPSESPSPRPASQSATREEPGLLDKVKSVITDQQVVADAKQVVEKSVIAPATLRWMSTKVLLHRDHDYIVHLVFDASNNFGVPIRSSVMVWIQTIDATQFKYLPMNPWMDCPDPCPAEMAAGYLEGVSVNSIEEAKALVEKQLKELERTNAGMRNRADAATQNATASSLRVAAAFKLTERQNGMDGELRLMTEPPNDGEEPNSAEHVPAELIVIDQKGAQRFHEPLRASRASLVPLTGVHFEPQWFAVEEDLSAGFGSYNGPTVSLVRVRGAQVEWASTKDEGSQRMTRIHVMKSLKTAWWVDPSSNGATASILEKACRPKDAGDFELRWTRYRFDGKAWTRAQRVADGFWEKEEETSGPDLAEFPR